MMLIHYLAPQATASLVCYLQEWLHCLLIVYVRAKFYDTVYPKYYFNHGLHYPILFLLFLCNFCKQLDASFLANTNRWEHCIC